jgi:hypothetical protein
LNTDFANHLAVGSTWLILQKEVVLEESEIGVDGEVSLAEVDEDGDLENRIRIKMDKFNLDVVMESTEEIASWEPESLLKKALDTTILLVFGEGISSPFASNHWRTTQGGGDGHLPT